MKRFNKIILPILLVLVMIFGSCTSVYAALPDTVLNELFEAFQGVSQGTQQASKNFIKKSFDSVGFMIDETGILIQKVKDAIHGVDDNFDNVNSTDKDVADWITQNVTSANGIVSFGDQYNAFILEYNKNFVEDSTGKTYYCCDLQQSQQLFTTAEITNISGILQDYPNYIFYLFYNGNDNWLLGLSPNGGQLYGVCRYRFENQDTWWSCIFYRAKTVNGILSCERFVAQSEDDMVAFYRTNGSGNDFEKIQLTYPWNGNYVNSSGQPYDSCYLCSLSGQSVGGNNFMQFPKGITMNNQSLLCFASELALQTYINTYGIGKQSYYYNNEVWSNFVDNSSGDYTVTSSNVNTVTYGDVITYINDSHDTNNNYPDNSTVNNWIETTNNNNTGSGGGGSGGNGSGSGDDSTGIFDFLSKIGQVLGNLIKNLGSVLTDLIEGIAETISGLFESIPTIFGDFLGALLGWLPDELQTLIILGISAMIIVGLIKVFRG